MDLIPEEMLKTIEELTKVNAELKEWKLDYNSHKQSVKRLSSRLRKLCKRLSPTTEIVLEMRQIADQIRELTKEAL